MRVFATFVFFTILAAFACTVSMTVVRDRIMSDQSFFWPAAFAIGFGLLTFFLGGVSWAGWQKTQEDPMWDEKMDREDRKRREAQAAGQ